MNKSPLSKVLILTFFDKLFVVELLFYYTCNITTTNSICFSTCINLCDPFAMTLFRKQDCLFYVGSSAFSLSHAYSTK